MSAQAKTAKEALDQAVTKYSYSKSVVEKLLTSTTNERTLNNKLKSLEDALAALNVAHTSWVSKADLPDDKLKEERYSREWLENEWSAVGDIQDTVEQTLSVSSINTNKQKLTVLINQMESLQQDISTKVDNLHSKTKPSTLAESSSLPHTSTTTSSTTFPVEACRLSNTCFQMTSALYQRQFCPLTQLVLLIEASSWKHFVASSKQKSPRSRFVLQSTLLIVPLPFPPAALKVSKWRRAKLHAFQVKPLTTPSLKGDG